MIETTALPDGNIQFELNGQFEELKATVAMAFVSNVLAKMQQAVPEGTPPEGGAIVYPDQVSIEKNLENGEPRLRLKFGKAVMVIDLPAGLLKQIGRDVQSV